MTRNRLVPTADDSTLRRRRSLERAAVVSRTVGAAFVVYSYVTLPADLAASAWGMRLSFGLALTGALLALNMMSVYGMRRPDSRHYPALNVVQLAMDTAILLVSVGAAGMNPQFQAWQLLLIPILVGAFRLNLAGALGVWAVSALWLVVLDRWGEAIVGDPLDSDDAITGMGMLLIVAVMAGLLTRTMDRQLNELQAIRTALHHQSRHDPLTNLANRTMLYEYAREALAAGQRLCVLVLDLDGFKAVNDTLGHAAGDELLRVVASRLTGQAREQDVVARLGGDEFVIVLPDVDRSLAGEIAERHRVAIAAPVTIAGQIVHIGASIGVSADVDDFDALLRAADAEMYESKAERRRIAPQRQAGEPVLEPVR
jgi:diguanylate cyclase (GGDEF)-like protein